MKEEKKRRSSRRTENDSKPECTIPKGAEPEFAAGRLSYVFLSYPSDEIATRAVRTRARFVFLDSLMSFVKKKIHLHHHLLGSLH